MNSISLAGWSLHRRFRRLEDPLKLLDFPQVAKEEFGLSMIELNSPFFESLEQTYLDQLLRNAEGQGVSMLNIAVDNQGNLSSPDAGERNQAVENHKRWLDAAAVLGCTAIRGNTGGRDHPHPADLIGYCIDSFGALAEYASSLNLVMMIENHGGVSADPDNIIAIMEGTKSPFLKSLPDFGNWPDPAKRYENLAKVAPYAHAVHVKTYDFSAEGEEISFSVERCVKIILESGYTNPMGIEYEGKSDDHEGVIRSIALVGKALMQSSS
ncbi:MAG: sugar phosphate isomerase/epimerase [Chloroflexi bacterium]|nr:sugar phosphate isomerase/epimerase [Chloroflexota bacterium]